MDDKLIQVLKDRDGIYEENEYNEDEEECEIVEVSEMEMLSLLDKNTDPLLIAQKLRKSQIDTLSLLTDQQANELFNKGYIVLENFVEESLGRAFYRDAMKLVEKDELKQPHETQLHKLDIYRDTTARSDLIKWIHQGDELCESFDQVIDIYRKIHTDLCKFINLGGKCEYQLGYYQKEAHYEKHRDSFPDDGNGSERRITMVGYFNYHWKQGDGGELKVFYGGDTLIEPLGGRAILFLSGVVDHQVMKSHENRIALTSWMS